MAMYGATVYVPMNRYFDTLAELRAIQRAQFVAVIVGHFQFAVGHHHAMHGDGDAVAVVLLLSMGQNSFHLGMKRAADAMMFAFCYDAPAKIHHHHYFRLNASIQPMYWLVVKCPNPNHM